MFNCKAKRAQAEVDVNAMIELDDVLRSVIAILKSAPEGSTISQVRITFHQDSSSGSMTMNPISFERGGSPSAAAEADWNKLDQVIISKIKHTNLGAAVRIYTKKYSRLREHDEILITATKVTHIYRHVSIPI